MPRRNEVNELTELLQLLVTEGQRIAQRFAQQHHAHPTDLEALIRVLHAGQRGVPLTAGELGQELGLSSGTVTALLDRLEHAGHVRRERDPADRRRVVVHYADTGLELARDFFQPLGRLHDEAVSDLSTAELVAARRYLSAALDAYRTYRRELEGTPR